MTQSHALVERIAGMLYQEPYTAVIEAIDPNMKQKTTICSPLVLHYSRGLLPNVLDPDRYREILSKKYHHAFGKKIDWDTHQIHYPLPDITELDGIHALSLTQSSARCSKKIISALEWQYIGPYDTETIETTIINFQQHLPQNSIFHIHA